MSLLQIIRSMWARRWIIIISVGACIIGAILALLLLPKVYTAESRALVSITADPITGEAVNNNFARAYMPTMAAMASDARVSARVVDSLGLTKDAALKQEYDDSGETRMDFRRWLAQRVATATKAFPVENANVLVIQYGGDTPQNAAITADAIRKAFIDETLAQKRDTASKSAVWFEQQAQQLRTRLQTAEVKKAQFERANNIVLLDDGTDADSVRLQSLSGAVDVPQVSSVGVAVNPNAGQIATLDARIATEMQVLGPNNPTIIDLRRQRAALAAVASSTGSSSVVSGPSIASQVAGARSRVMSQRGKIEEARRLFTDVKVLQDQYGKLQARGAELRQFAVSNESGVSALDNAVPPGEPSSPKIGKILGGAVGFGLVLGVLLALISELLYRRVRVNKDLEGLGVPVIGVITTNNIPLLLREA